MRSSVSLLRPARLAVLNLEALDFCERNELEPVSRLNGLDAAGLDHPRQLALVDAGHLGGSGLPDCVLRVHGPNDTRWQKIINKIA